MSGDRSLGIGDLPVAGPVSSTDTLAICQSPTGCFAADSSVTLRGVSQSQLATYYQSTFAGTAPITFGGGNIGLAIDSTLQVTAGQLGVVAPSGPPIVVPSAPLLGGNGSILGSVALGTNLSLSGAFPNQTLNAAGITGGPFLPLSGGTVTGEIISAVTPTNTDSLTTNRVLSEQIGTIAGALQNYLPLVGGVLTGNLQVPAGSVSAPSLAIGFANRGFFSTSTGVSLTINGVSPWSFTPTLVSSFIPIAMNNNAITGLPTPVNPTDAVNKTYADSLAVPGGFLPLSGGTMQGPITTANNNATIQVPYQGGVSGPSLRIGEPTTGFYRTGAPAASALYLSVNQIPIQTWDPSNTPRGWSQMALDLNMTNHYITSVLDPVNPQDVATKNYVDTRPGGGGGITGITAGLGITVTADPVSPTVALTPGAQGGLDISFGGTGGTTAPQARTNLGLTAIAVQAPPLGTVYGGTQRNQWNLYDILMGGGTVGTQLLSIPAGGVTEVLHGGAPPSYGLVSLTNNVSGTLPVGSGGTGATTFTTGNFIGMGGAGAFVGVPTPIAVGLGGTGAITFTPSDALLLGSGAAAVRASQLMTQTSDAAGLQLRTAGGPAGGVNSPYIDMYWASGTIGSPGPSQTNDALGGVFAGGADSTGWSNGGECSILCAAADNWTPTSHPTQITLGTTAPGQTGPIARLRARQGVFIGNTTDPGIGRLNIEAGLYVAGIGANNLAISWLAGIDPNNAVLVVAQRAMTITNVMVVIRAPNTGASLVIRRADGTGMISSFDLGQPAAVYDITPSITTLAVRDFLWLATSGTFTTSVAHITVAVA